MIEAMYNFLNTDTVRDLGAYLTVTAPTAVAYTVTVRWWIDASQVTNLVFITQSVNSAVNAWITDNANGIGGSINPATLSRAVINAGASYCIVDDPSARVGLSLSETGVLTNDPVVTYEGSESDLQPYATRTR